MNLYWITSPGGNPISTNHNGSLLEYSDAESATALPLAQSPKAATFPEILIVSPYAVVTVSSNVTATEVGFAHELVLVLKDALLVVEVGDLVVVVELPSPVGNDCVSRGPRVVRDYESSTDRRCRFLSAER